MTIGGDLKAQHNWITWSGGDCPVDGDEIVDVELLSGDKHEGHLARMCCWQWTDPESDQHIIAYRVVEDREGSMTEKNNVEKTLNERGERYGDFSDHAEIAQAIQDAMRNTAGWHKLDAVKKQALTVIADKQARILSGDPNYDDNWHDIQGYARLVEERL